MNQLDTLQKWIEIGRDRSLSWLFDLYYGVETRQDVELYNMDVHSLNISKARKYQATHLWIFFKCFYKLKLDWTRYHFIDLGCGKGRSLLMASFFPFQRIIGVEFAADLCLQCNQNIETFLKRRPERMMEFEVLNMDILDFIPNTKPNIYYLYNPFNGEVLKKLIDRLSKFITQDDFFIFLNPLRGYLLELAGMQKILQLNSPNHNKVLHVYKPQKQITNESALP